MFRIVEEFPIDLIFKKSEGPYISIYQPTHRYKSPEKDQDRIRFKNLLSEVEKSLGLEYSKKEVEVIVKPLVSLLEDKTFWNTTYEGGVAVLLLDGELVIYRLKREVKEIAIVSDSFHIKPLIRIFQSADRYYILGVNMKRFEVYEGNRYGIEKIEFDEEIPTTMEDVLGDKFTEKYLSAGRHMSQGVKSTGAHGHGGKKDEVEIDNEKFFRYVDSFIEAEFSNPTRLPLILVGLDEHQGLFRRISQNKYLLKNGIASNFEVMDKKELEEKAWEIMLPIYENKTKELVEEFNDFSANHKASGDLSQVIRAISEGKVSKILIESDKIIPGKIDFEKGTIITGELKDPKFGDLLDEIAESVIENRGQVVMLPKEKMPTDTGVAAIFRY